MPATAAIVHSNRVGGPERVLDMVSERAREGFNRVEDVISPAELSEISKQYAALAGFALGLRNAATPS